MYWFYIHDVRMINVHLIELHDNQCVVERTTGNKIPIHADTRKNPASYLVESEVRLKKCIIIFFLFSREPNVIIHSIRFWMASWSIVLWSFSGFPESFVVREFQMNIDYTIQTISKRD